MKEGARERKCLAAQPAIEFPQKGQIAPGPILLCFGSYISLMAVCSTFARQRLDLLGQGCVLLLQDNLQLLQLLRRLRKKRFRWLRQQSCIKSQARIILRTLQRVGRATQ
ncbi:MAG: hypothetical protein JWM16_2874 [Verrucomicrobiales bacterium]|nr:hypothetical protein [Verrucomicrobiales bacterium]